MHRTPAIALAAALALAAPATAQIYVDIGAQAGTPSSGYVAAHPPFPPGAPALWNTVPADATGVPLLRTDGSPSGVTLTITGGGAYAFDHPGTTGDDEALLDDGSRSAGTQTLTFTGLDAARCDLDYVYLLGENGEQTRVRLFYGPQPDDGTQQHDGGGVYAGALVEGVTHVLDVGDFYCDFGFGFDLVIEVSPAPGSSFGTICGVQFPPNPFYNSLCNGYDGSLASCPCGAGYASSGCESPIPAMQGGGTTGGVQLLFDRQEYVPENRATMSAYGFPSASAPGSVLFRGEQLEPGGPVPFGDGLRCIGGGVIVRLGATVASGGASTHTFGHSAMTGSGFFYYQLWYRSLPASYCDPASAFNASNGTYLIW